MLCKGQKNFYLIILDILTHLKFKKEPSRFKFKSESCLYL